MQNREERICKTKECNKIVPVESKSQYCPLCLNRRKEKFDKIKDNVKKAGQATFAVASLVISTATLLNKRK